jgi:hypothetical protein
MGESLSISVGTKLAVLFALAAMSWNGLAAQQGAPPAGTDPATQGRSQNADKPQSTSSGENKNTQEKKTPEPASQGKVAGTSNDRLFYTLPNFLSLEGSGKLPPMSAKDKFKVVALGTFDYVEYPWWGILAAIGQADNSEPAFGQGWVAYAKRYGTTMGDSMVENFMVGAVFPSVLHQDPRFYQSERGGFWTKSGYAVSRIFVTRSDSGHSQFNYSEIFGSATAAAISTYTYHPRSTFVSTPTNPHLFIASDRTLGNAANVWATQLALDTITIAVKEFWPDIHRKIAKKQKPAQEGTPQH